MIQAERWSETMAIAAALIEYWNPAVVLKLAPLAHLDDEQLFEVLSAERLTASPDSGDTA